MRKQIRKDLREQLARVKRLLERVQADQALPVDESPRKEFRYLQLLAAGGRLERFLQSADALGVNLGAITVSAQRALNDLAKAARQLKVDGPLTDVERWLGVAETGDAKTAEFTVDEALEAVFDLEDLADARRFAGARYLPAHTPRAPSVQSASGAKSKLDSLESGEWQRLHEYLQQYRRRSMYFGAARKQFENLWQGFEEMKTNSIEKVLDDLRRQENSAEDADRLPGLVKAISGMTQELGFDGMVDALLDGVGITDISLAGGVNIIPGNTKGSCEPTVIALSRAEGRKLKLPNVLHALRSHLIECRQTRMAVVVTDSWDARMFHREHRTDWTLFRKQGVTFVVLLAEPATGAYSLIPVTLD